MKNNTFLDSQIAFQKSKLQKMMEGDVHLYGPPNLHAVVFDKACNDAINSALASDNMDQMNVALETLKKNVQDVSNNSGLKQNILSQIDSLKKSSDIGDKALVVNAIKEFDYAFWTACVTLNMENGFESDTVGVFISNHDGVSGKDFSTHIVPFSKSTTRDYIVRVGEGFDDSRNLTGKIDTLDSHAMTLAVYTMKASKKGVYDIPAEVDAPILTGETVRIPFYIHFEIK